MVTKSVCRDRADEAPRRRCRGTRPLAALALLALGAAGWLLFREPAPPPPLLPAELNRRSPDAGARPGTEQETLTKLITVSVPQRYNGPEQIADTASRAGDHNYYEPENSINGRSNSADHLDDSSISVVNDNVHSKGKTPSQFGELDQRAPIGSVSPNSADRDNTDIYRNSIRRVRDIRRDNRNRTRTDTTKRRHFRSRGTNPYRRHSRHKANLEERRINRNNVNGTAIKQPSRGEVDRPKRFSYVDGNGVLRYTYIPLMDCCDPPPGCRYPSYRPMPVRPSYGPRSKQWKGLRYGCNCNERGSEIRSCDIKTGQCRCLPHVVGLTCDHCEPGHWGLTTGSGCSRCVCDPMGAERGGEGGTLCDQHSGRCHCKPGVGGTACDVCLPGHYGFGDRGCIKCENCSVGRICDPDTGRCVCPALSQGPACRDCRPGSWGLVPNKGCKYCHCSPSGSVSAQCEVVSGSCKCQKGYAGAHCDTCAPHHFGYPHCRPCACHIPGTSVETCEGDACSCDQTGQCSCKINVVGQKCDECKDGTFGLSIASPSGCTQCFCFGRSSHCTQAGLTWGLLRLNTPRVLQVRPTALDSDQFDSSVRFIHIFNIGEPPIDLSSDEQDLELNVTNGITIIPDTTGNITIGTNYDLAYPLYWELPKKFLGDRVTSYGGFLKFYIESSGITEKIPSSILRQYPLVQLHAQGVLVLEYFEPYPVDNGEYEVWFHESLWLMRNPLTAPSQLQSSGREVNRATLMIALQHVDAIFIRGTHYSSPTEAILSNVVMDTAIPILGHPPYLASSVELCSCPREYNSTSCQDASIGFFIPKYQAIGKTEISPTQLIGKAEPCQCNGRSETCDKDTGYCSNCREYTGGPNCERCGDGYYGQPLEEGGCRSCPCPHTARNNAIACNVHPHRVQCHCREGYSGADCSVCAVGWWLGHDGRCRQCECDAGGVVGGGRGHAPLPCHPTTGQCPCLPHVTGMRCDTCLTPRHFLEGSLCTPCDNCSQTLLDTVELMSYELIRDTDHIKNTSIPKPWIALYKISNKTRNVKIDLERTITSIQGVLALPENSFNDMRQRSEELQHQSNFLDRIWNDTTIEACELRQDANMVFDNLMNLRKKLENKINELEYFSRSDRHLNVNKVVKEARHMLKKIKELDLSHLMQNADDIFDKANIQSAIISEYIYKLKDHENKIKGIKERFDTWHNKTDEIIEFKEAAWDTIDEVEAAIKRFKNTYNYIIEKNVQSEAIYNDILKLQDQHLNQESTVLLQECEDDILNLKSLGPLLEHLTNQTAEKEGILSRINPEYQDKYLEPAMKHANNLSSLALSLKNLFTETRLSADSAVTASSAYKDIVQGMNAAREASIQALETAELAKEAVSGDNISLLEMSIASKDSSIKHLDMGKQQSLKVKEMLSELEKSKQKVERIRVAIRGIAWKDKDLYVLTSNLSTIRVDAHLAVANNKSDRVYENMRALYKEADSIHKDALYKLRMKLQDLQSNGDDKIGGAEENVSLLRGNIRRASELALSLMDAVQLREAEVAKANSTLAEKIQRLRDQIQRAKHAADGIRIPLTSSFEKGCLRSYRLTNLAPSTTTRLSATISLTPENSHDSVLFHLPSTINSDFVKLELINRKIRFSWNLGGSSAYITYPEVLETYSDSSSDSSWYKVHVDRVWNIGKLWVRKVVSSPESALNAQVPVTNTSSPNWGVLDVKSGDLAWVGSLGTQLQKNAGLAGCLQQLSYNGKQIGLWNFHTQPNENSCTGCIEGVEEIKASEQNMYYMNGAGYSVLKRSDLRPFNKNQFSILLTFRTFDENALLFLAVDEVNNRSVSLQLREGRVVFRIDYSGDSRLEINTTEKYNTGKFIQVQAARVFIKRKIEKGSLKVDGYEQLGSPNPPVIHSTSIPDLTNSDYLLGGTPPLWRPPSIIRSLPPPFLGCLGDLTIDQEGYNPLDTAVHYGVESTCSDKPLTSVGFYGDGFLELPGHTLRRKSHLGFMFRTLQSNAFLLLSAPRHYYITRTNEVIPEYAYTTESELTSVEESGHNNDGFYSFSLVDGQIHLLMNAGKGDLKLVSNGSALSDGQFHALSVVKKNRRVELFIDDVAQATGTLPPGAVVIHAIPQSVEGNGSGGLFLGGVPEHLNETDVTDQHIASTISLRGAIKDIVFDGSVVSMQDVVSMNHALIGRLGPPMGEEYEIGANLLNTQELNPDDNKTSKGCHKVYSYTLEPGAVKFGDVSNSYAQVHLARRNIWHQDFVLEFDYRTFYPNGLLFLSPGTKAKQRHLIAVYLKDGKVTLTMKARRKLETSIQLVTNDGQWHHVLIRSTHKRLSITVGPRSALVKMPKVLYLSNMLYVGGLPDKTVSLNIPEHMLKMEGFKGCIRRLMVNGKPEDLVKDAALHQNVGQCFPAIERGSYFPGDAYAIYKRQFVIGSHLELQLEFRTVEMNGVLLSIAHTDKNSPALSLELNNAKVVLSVLTLSGRTFTVETSLPTQFGLCDNTWHNISALFSDDELTVRVDQLPEETDVGTGPGLSPTTPPSINQPLLQSPLYIGGLPDGAPPGTLTTKENFKGCIRNVSIRGHRRDWTDMDYLHNLLLSSCPVQ